MGRESHHFSTKDRTFLRAISGPYNLQDELNRVRSVPRVVKGCQLKLQDGPQTYIRSALFPNRKNRCRVLRILRRVSLKTITTTKTSLCC